MRPDPDDDLAPLFAARIEPNAPFLAERIIARAKHLPQRRGLFSTLSALLAVDLRAPVPAFAMASLLLLGIFATQPFASRIEAEMTPEPVAVSDIPTAFYDEAAL